MNDPDPEEDLTLGATFPPPPSHHLKFTDHNLRLLALLTNGQASPSASSSSPTPFDPKGKQREILKDEEDVPDWDLQVELTAPRVDWIEAGGEYEMYGSTYFIPARVPDVEGLGVKRLVPADTSDVKPHLITLLHSFLHTNLLLLAAITHPPPPLLSEDYEEQRQQSVAAPYVERMTEIGVNMMAAVNALRGAQSCVTLEQMMTAQLGRRREETKNIKAKCAELAQTLATFRSGNSSRSSSRMEVDDGLAAAVISKSSYPPPASTPSDESRARVAHDRELWASLDAI